MSFVSDVFVGFYTIRTFVQVREMIIDTTPLPKTKSRTGHGKLPPLHEVKIAVPPSVIKFTGIVIHINEDVRNA